MSVFPSGPSLQGAGEGIACRGGRAEETGTWQNKRRECAVTGPGLNNYNSCGINLLQTPRPADMSVTKTCHDVMCVMCLEETVVTV